MGAASTDRSGIAADMLYATVISYDPSAKKYLNNDSEIHKVDHENLRDYLRGIAAKHSPEEFLSAYFDCLRWIGESYLSTENYQEYRAKLELIINMTIKLKEKNLIVSDLIRLGVLYQVNYLATTTIEEVRSTVGGHYV